MLMKFADATKLEGVTNNNVDTGLIQMDVKKLVKNNDGNKKSKEKLGNIRWINFSLRKSNIKEM